MASSVFVTIFSASSESRRSRNSSVEAGGNFGARPKPPFARSKVRAIPCSASSSSAEVSGSADGSIRAEWPTASTSRCACATMSPRCVRHASATASSSCGNDGIPCRGSGGKYVPA